MSVARDIIYIGRRTLREIAADVCRRRNVTLDELRSGRRLRHLVHARHEIWWIARQQTNRSFPSLAEFLGCLDHTSVMHGVRAHERRMRAVNLEGEVGEKLCTTGPGVVPTAASERPWPRHTVECQTP